MAKKYFPKVNPGDAVTAERFNQLQREVARLSNVTISGGTVSNHPGGMLFSVPRIPPGLFVIQLITPLIRNVLSESGSNGFLMQWDDATEEFISTGVVVDVYTDARTRGFFAVEYDNTIDDPGIAEPDILICRKEGERYYPISCGRELAWFEVIGNLKTGGGSVSVSSANVLEWEPGKWEIPTALTNTVYPGPSWHGVAYGRNSANSWGDLVLAQLHGDRFYAVAGARTQVEATVTESGGIDAGATGDVEIILPQGYDRTGNGPDGSTPATAREITDTARAFVDLDENDEVILVWTQENDWLAWSLHACFTIRQGRPKPFRTIFTPPAGLVAEKASALLVEASHARRVELAADVRFADCDPRREFFICQLLRSARHMLDRRFREVRRLADDPRRFGLRPGFKRQHGFQEHWLRFWHGFWLDVASGRLTNRRLACCTRNQPVHRSLSRAIHAELPASKNGYRLRRDFETAINAVAFRHGCLSRWKKQERTDNPRRRRNPAGPTSA